MLSQLKDQRESGDCDPFTAFDREDGGAGRRPGGRFVRAIGQIARDRVTAGPG